MSLLYREEDEPVISVSDDTYKDLALHELCNAISTDSSNQELIQSVFSKIPTGYETITYRQAILQDFLDKKEMCDELEIILEKLNTLKEFKSHRRMDADRKSSIWELLDYLQELEVYTETVEDMDRVLQLYAPKSQGLTEIAQRVHKIIIDGQLEELRTALSGLRADISTTKSMTFGVNFTPDLYPQDVVIMGFHNAKIMPKMTLKDQYDNRFLKNGQFGIRDPLLDTLTREIEGHMAKEMRRMKRVFRDYISLDGYFLVELCSELQYYLLMARFERKLKASGNPICMPVLSYDSQSVNMQGVYNIRLAIDGEEQIVRNDFVFSKEERIYILTGPNRGGKTMLTQGIGIAAFMASQGLFVAAEKYEGFPFDRILTHFPADENETVNFGRLGEEAIRIQQIVKEADEHSLVLLNETYSTTCASDGLYLAKDLVHVLKNRNIPCIYNTHIHALARMTDEMNRWEGTSAVISIIMEIVDNENTFRVLRSEPDTSSYARNVALAYGITYEQMMGIEQQGVT
ncbi:MAG: hypothetical protein J6B50_08100 [Lachnospiraceae bacterium]|nr:hypothetical protein [Lachnospiraceae bacterium]